MLMGMIVWMARGLLCVNEGISSALVCLKYSYDESECYLESILLESSKFALNVALWAGFNRSNAL